MGKRGKPQVIWDKLRKRKCQLPIKRYVFELRLTSNRVPAQSESAPLHLSTTPAVLDHPLEVATNSTVESGPDDQSTTNGSSSPKKRSADEAELNEPDSTIAKRSKADSHLHQLLPDPPTGTISLFCKEDFREHLCRCPECYPRLKEFPQLLEEEESYEPPVSESGEEGGQSVGTGSLLDRGEAALSNVDRVRAIGSLAEICCFVTRANASQRV